MRRLQLVGEDLTADMNDTIHAMIEATLQTMSAKFTQISEQPDVILSRVEDPPRLRAETSQQQASSEELDNFLSNVASLLHALHGTVNQLRDRVPMASGRRVALFSSVPPNNSLERTQPQRGFMYDVAVLRRSARGR